MRHFYSPLRYPGGKNCIFNFVSTLFYENNFVGIKYAEPYAGGAGLALRLLFEGYVSHVYINDFDKSIFSFWKSITEQPEDFCDWIRTVDISIDNWLLFKEMQKHKDECDSFELAKSTFFLNRTNVSGVIKGGVIGGLNQSGKYKIDARFNKDELIKRIMLIGKSRKNITVSSYDGIDFINKMDKKNDSIFIYLDPPYYKKGAELYMNYFQDKNHLDLAKKVLQLKQHWMASYDNHDFILNLYSSMNRITYQLSQNTSNRVGDEILIFPNRVSFHSSLSQLKTPILIP
jgi:DNA adenine methylase